MIENARLLAEQMARDCNEIGCIRKRSQYAVILGLKEEHVKYLMKQYRNEIAERLPEQYRAMFLARSPRFATLKGSVRDIRVNVPTEGTSVSNDGADIVPDNSAPVQLADLIDHAQRTQEIYRDVSPLLRAVEVFIETDKPVIIAPTSDAHLGSLGCDYDAWRRHYGQLTDTPGLRVVWLGDMIENCSCFPNLRSVLSQVLSVELQQEALEIIVRDLAPRTLAAVYSNHGPGRDDKRSGVARERRLWQHSGAPWFDGVALLRVLVGKDEASAQTYTILASHKPMGKSQHNKLYGAWKLWSRIFPADIVMTAHLHLPAYMVDTSMTLARDLGYRVGGKRIFIATGTCNTEAEYALREYGNSGLAAFPCVVLHPDRHDIHAFWSIDDAEAFRRGISNE